VFYDGECGFCDRCVQWILKHDRSKAFAFAPLQGITAQKYLAWLPSSDTLVPIENYNGSAPKIYKFGQGGFRILWLLGGRFCLLGWPFFLPPILYNWGYRLIAKYRVHKSCYLQKSRDQFLP
jgi:predicted DCC family thiol-disulfide oxidoreductase YuxK